MKLTDHPDVSGNKRDDRFPSLNPNNLKDGEHIPCLGGPYDGGTAKVSVLFPNMNGGMPSSLLKVGEEGYYELESRTWKWTGLKLVKP